MVKTIVKNPFVGTSAPNERELIPADDFLPIYLVGFPLTIPGQGYFFYCPTTTCRKRGWGDVQEIPLESPSLIGMVPQPISACESDGPEISIATSIKDFFIVENPNTPPEKQCLAEYWTTGFLDLKDAKEWKDEVATLFPMLAKDWKEKTGEDITIDFSPETLCIKPAVIPKRRFYMPIKKSLGGETKEVAVSLIKGLWSTPKREEYIRIGKLFKNDPLQWSSRVRGGQMVEKIVKNPKDPDSERIVRISPAPIPVWLVGWEGDNKDGGKSLWLPVSECREGPCELKEVILGDDGKVISQSFRSIDLDWDENPREFDRTYEEDIFSEILEEESMSEYWTCGFLSKEEAEEWKAEVEENEEMMEALVEGEDDLKILPALIAPGFPYVLLKESWGGETNEVAFCRLLPAF